MPLVAKRTEDAVVLSALRSVHSALFFFFFFGHWEGGVVNFGAVGQPTNLGIFQIFLGYYIHFRSNEKDTKTP